MKAYTLTMTTRTYFGNRCVEEAVKKEKQTLGDKPLLITTGGVLKQLGFLDEMTK